MIHRKFTLFCVVMLLSSAAFFLWAYNASMSKLQNINCNTRYDFFMGDYSLNSSLTVSNTKNQGSISLLGNYYKKKELITPFRLFSHYSIKRKNNFYSAKMINSFINPNELLKDSKFVFMINGLTFSEGALSVYQIFNYGDNNYIFLHHGVPLFVCQNMKRPYKREANVPPYNTVTTAH